MSNRDRIARAAEEARIAAEEKAAKKASRSGKREKTSSKKPKTPARMKIVWDVCGPAGTAIKSFAYAEKAAAEADAAARTRSSGRTHFVRESRVPME